MFDKHVYVRNEIDYFKLGKLISETLKEENEKVLEAKLRSFLEKTYDFEDKIKDRSFIQIIEEEHFKGSLNDFRKNVGLTEEEMKKLWNRTLYNYRKNIVKTEKEINELFDLGKRFK